jgi:DNA-binding transcriptional LysR family regulator
MWSLLERLKRNLSPAVEKALRAGEVDKAVVRYEPGDREFACLVVFTLSMMVVVCLADKRFVSALDCLGCFALKK